MILSEYTIESVKREVKSGKGETKGGFVVSNILFKKWISVMVERGSDCYQLNEKCSYLKANGIRCRIKNVSIMGATDGSMGMGMVSVRSVSLDVYYKDMEKAQQLLNK